MIARITIFMFLLILLPDIYIDLRIIRRKTRNLWWQRLLWWIPGIIMLAYTAYMVTIPDFAPRSMSVLTTYLFLVGVIVVPKAVFAVCSLLGWGHCRFHHTTNNWGNLVGMLLGTVVIVIVMYGSTLGFRKLVVRHEDYYSADLPKAFDGYRIVHFSDAHVGSYVGSSASVLERAIDTINAQKPDMIVFTGDIQNMQPTELAPFAADFSRLKAKDGVFSILGNHDYSGYIKADEAVKAANERKLQEYERSFGWTLLLNDNRTVRRGNDSIVIAGMENDGRPPFPQKGDVAKSLAGVKDGTFVIMLEHDPSAWRRKILPDTKAQLTLSGHTHAMQFSVFGWSPASFIYKEWGGMYTEGERAINVSTGMGGFIPFRIGASNEIVVITLHRK